MGEVTMNKCYYRIVWENYPSDKTPLNEQNLNKMDVAVDEMDNRIISLDTTKFSKEEAQSLVKYIEYDDDTGIFTITHYNGASYTIDTLLEKLAINFDYDYQAQRLIIELSDGTVRYVDLSALITQYEFLNSDTINFTITIDGEVRAEIAEGSIEEKHLRPNYLADIEVEVAKAKSSADNAENSAKEAESYAHGGTGTRENEYADNAMEYARQAKESAEQAKDIVTQDVVLKSEKGVANGVASLDNGGKVPSTQLPDTSGAVTSVNGKIGDVNITVEDIGAVDSDTVNALINSATNPINTSIERISASVENLESEKQDTITGAATTIASNNLTASRALVSNKNGKIAVVDTTSTELGYVHGVTSAIQTQLNGKLNKSGGTLSGALDTRDLAIAKDYRLILYNTDGSFGYIKQYGNQQLVIRSSIEDDYGIYIGVREGVWSLASYVNNNLNLGSTGFKWRNIYATNGTIQTSDRNAKDNIHYLEDNDIYVQLLMKLLPCSFTYKNTSENTNHDRTHIGFIAQDVEDAMSELSLTSLDFAGFCKDQKVISKMVKETIIDEKTGEEKEVEQIIEEKIEGEYIYSLRYQEFIALITKVLQKSCKRLDDLEYRLSVLENKIPL